MTTRWHAALFLAAFATGMGRAAPASGPKAGANVAASRGNRAAEQRSGIWSCTRRWIGERLRVELRVCGSRQISIARKLDPAVRIHLVDQRVEHDPSRKRPIRTAVVKARHTGALRHQRAAVAHIPAQIVIVAAGLELLVLCFDRFGSCRAGTMPRGEEVGVIEHHRRVAEYIVDIADDRSTRHVLPRRSARAA